MRKIYTKPRRDKKAEKLAFLQKYAMNHWIKARKEADEEVSRECEMWCVCGRLCTGLHESSCSRFKARVDNIAINKLKPLWEEKKLVYPKIMI